MKSIIEARCKICGVWMQAKDINNALNKYVTKAELKELKSE